VLWRRECMAYNFNKIKRIIGGSLQKLIDELNKIIIHIDKEHEKIKTETDRFHALSEIVIAEVTDDYDIVYDDDGEIVTTI
jgi:hypothetical protein